MTSRINNVYFTWLCDLICRDRYSEKTSFVKLLSHLHDTEFYYVLDRDVNRAEDGIYLRYRFSYHNTDIGDDIESYINGPCSVLEMMIALAIRCEENIMDDPTIGNRTGQWFWGMITTLGLGAMYDTQYDAEYVDEVLERFLKREYERDGTGGLFRVRNCNYDLRNVEIWYQLCWYLDSIT